MFERRFFKNLDFLFVFILLLLLGASLLILSTASLNVIASQPYFYVKNQAMWIGVGLVIAVGVASIDYQKFRKYSWWIYGLNLALLLAVFS